MEAQASVGLRHERGVVIYGGSSDSLNVIPSRLVLLPHGRRWLSNTLVQFVTFSHNNKY